MPDMEEIYKTVRRTWFERLCTFPWNPFRATRQVRDYAAELGHVNRHAKPRPPAGMIRPEGGWPRAPYLRDVVRTHSMPPMRQPLPPVDDRRVDDSMPASLFGLMGAAAVSEPAPPPVEPFVSGSGGQFAGGGATGSWDSSDSSGSASSDSGSSSSDGGSSSSSGD